jgi:hypothetical protein
MSRDTVEDVARHHGPFSTSLRLVDLTGIECELSQDLSVGVQNADVAVGHEDHDPCSVVPTSDSYAVERALVTQCDLPLFTLS